MGTSLQVNSGEVEAGNEQSLEGLDLDDEEESSSVINLSEQDSAGPGDGKGAGRHEKKRSEIDWSSIMAPGGGKGDDESAGGATDPSRFSVSRATLIYLLYIFTYSQPARHFFNCKF